MNIQHQLLAKQVEQLHALYQKESWSKGRTLEETRRCIAGSTLCVALVDDDNNLAAFARVLTDGIFKALIFDVIVDEKYRGQGLGNQVITTIKKHPMLARVKHLELYCLPELEPFYEQQGFNTDVGNMRLMRRVSE